MELLSQGTVQIHGLLPRASNATLLVTMTYEGTETLAVYKPRRGENPLWDFAAGTLCLREQAAWIVDDALGWGLIPPTVLRDGPAGFGAFQLFIEQTPELDLDSLLETHLFDLHRLTILDAVINNADRKAGHCLLDTRGKLWAVDHGVTFHPEPKLRTVIWAFASDEIPASILGDLRRLELNGKLDEVLSPAEIDALLGRISGLCHTGLFPEPGAHPIPWPPW